MQSYVKFLYISNNVAILVILIEKHELNIFHFNFFLFNDNAEVQPDEYQIKSHVTTYFILPPPNTTRVKVYMHKQ